MQLAFNEEGQKRPSFSFLIQVFVILFAFLFLTLSTLFDFKPVTHSNQKIAFEASTLGHLTLGFGMVMSDGFWIRVLQEIDYKDSTDSAITKGWVFHMLDAITTLDHRFKIAYLVGGTVLSVLVKDTEGARIIYDRGVENIKGEWNLEYRDGFHYMHWVKDCTKAAALFHQAMIDGAPFWVGDLAKRLYSREGQNAIARTIYLDGLHRFAGKREEKYFRQKLEELAQEKVKPEDNLKVDCK